MDVGLRLAELKDKCLLYRWVNSKGSLGIKIKTDKKLVLQLMKYGLQKD